MSTFFLKRILGIRFSEYRELVSTNTMYPFWLILGSHFGQNLPLSFIICKFVHNLMVKGFYFYNDVR